MRYLVGLNNGNIDRNKMTDEYITYMAVSTSLIKIYTAILLTFKSCERIRTSKYRVCVCVCACVRARARACACARARACSCACACACACVCVCVFYIFIS